MALDAQRNWDVSMAESLERLRLTAERKTHSVKSTKDGMILANGDAKHNGLQLNWTGPSIYLPDEIIINILEYVAPTRESQRTLAACCLLGHQWYEAAVPLLYRHPHLYGKNFDPFARTVCPSINLHVRKSPLSALVRDLDMGNLVHQGSKSMTARLLGRTKEGLEGFRAPQASFAINCLPALAKCVNLESLDLSLVSESPPLPDLFKVVAHLHKLKSFRLPRSAGFGAHDAHGDFVWPPNLEYLVLSGGIDAHFLRGDVQFPQTLRSLTIEHCPLARRLPVARLLFNSVRSLALLESVKISHMPRFVPHALDDILFVLPQIKRLSVSVDYITPAAFDQGHHPHLLYAETSLEAEPTSQPLRHENLHTLELTNSGNPSVEDKISPIDIMIALDQGVFPSLRVVRVAKSLYWHSGDTSADAEALADALQEASKLDWENKQGIFEGLGFEAWEKADWAAPAGVWSFDDKAS